MVIHGIVIDALDPTLVAVGIVIGSLSTLAIVRHLSHRHDEA